MRPASITDPVLAYISSSIREAMEGVVNRSAERSQIIDAENGEKSQGYGGRPQRLLPVFVAQ